MHKEWREVAEIWHEGKLVATVTGFHLKIQENSSEDVDVAWQAEIEKEEAQVKYPIDPCASCLKRADYCAERELGGCSIYNIWKENNGAFKV